jgi:hypothetical protein
MLPLASSELSCSDFAANLAIPNSATSYSQMSFVPTSYIDRVLGAIIFDLNGLPKEYFTSSEKLDAKWAQTIFQALGLRSLLMASLQLEGFHHFTVQGNESCAVVVKQKSHYTALMLKQSEEEISAHLVEWVQNFQTSILHEDPRFQCA